MALFPLALASSSDVAVIHRKLSRRVALPRIALSLFGLFLVLVLLEAGTRIAARFQRGSAEETWAIYDPEIGYRLRPNFGDHNAHGLRDDPISAEKTKFRILMLGDSIPYYGETIADTVVGRLETRLRRDPSAVPTDVINAATKGYTNYQELLFLKAHGLQFTPDLVGVFFCLNDLHKFTHQFVVQDGEIVGESYDFSDEAIRSVDSALYRLARKSHFLVWLRHRLSISESLIQLMLRDGFTFDFRPDFSNAWKAESWAAIEDQLGEMVSLGRANDFRVFLIVSPFGEQLREDYLARDLEYVTFPQRQLRGICQRLEIPCLDLFSQIDPDVHLLNDQIHLTAAGRELVAEKIAVFLLDAGLIPRTEASPGRSVDAH